MSDTTILEPVIRLSRDIRQAALTLGDEEARFLVDAYYIMQDDRKRTFAQQRTLSEGGEPNLVISWLADQSTTLESQIKSALDIYTRNHVMGSWMRDVYGIGPVISAGLLAHIYMGTWCDVCHGRDEDDCRERQKDAKSRKKFNCEMHPWTPVESIPTTGHIWQFAGIAGDGQHPWEKNTKRPFNAQLKTLCWKTGQSFMKFSNEPQCTYGRHYRQQKEKYIAKNDAGGFAARAAERSATVGRDTESWAWYNACYPLGTARAYEDAGYYLGAAPEAKVKAKQDLLKTRRLEPGQGAGMLPPAHIDAMARRWAVKLFLAHLHDEWYERHFKKPAPLPYPIAILGHAHLI